MSIQGVCAQKLNRLFDCSGPRQTPNYNSSLLTLHSRLTFIILCDTSQYLLGILPFVHDIYSPQAKMDTCLSHTTQFCLQQTLYSPPLTLNGCVLTPAFMQKKFSSGVRMCLCMNTYNHTHPLQSSYIYSVRILIK